MSRGRAAVVTGLGVVSPLGSTTASFWNGLVEGRIATAPVTRFDVSGYSSRMGGEVRDLDPAASYLKLDPREHERSTQLSVAAAHRAVAAAKLSGADFEALGSRAGIVAGTVVANRPGLEPLVSDAHRAQAVPRPFSFDRHRAELIARAPALELGIFGPVQVLPVACAAGNAAIAHAADLIADDHCDLMLAGGADELSPAMYLMFSQHDSMAPDVVRPFDRRRRGLILSEGAAFLVVEAEEHARARGARVLARVAGHADFPDGHDMVHPHPEGLGALRSMRAALARAELPPDALGWVCAHGTGTPANDSIEARAIRDAVPGAAVSSIKSMLGHTQGAAGAIAAVACVLALERGAIPPTMSCEELDPECPVDVVRDRPRKASLRAVMNNAFGFGGNTSCVIFTAGA